MATGTIKIPHFEKITLTKVSSKIADHGVTAYRNGDILYVRGWFNLTTALNANEIMFNLPSDLHILSFSYGVAFAGTGNNPAAGVFAINENTNGQARIISTSAMTTSYWNIVTVPVMLSSVFTG